MNNFALLAGILPLIIFVIVDTFSTLKVALITAVIIALLEAIFSIYYIGTLDLITAFSFLMIGVFSYFAYKKDDEKLFMWQPVIISWVFGGYILITKLFGNDLILDLSTKYSALLPEAYREKLAMPFLIESMKMMSYTMSFSFIAHGLVTLYAAYRLGKWWWLAARGVGFYLFMAIAVYSAQLLVLKKYMS